jgi:hypothetical protein
VVSNYYCVANLSQCLSKLCNLLLCYILVTDCKSWINTGAGWRRNDAYKPKTIINGKGVRILDVNGNGLVDYLSI